MPRATASAIERHDSTSVTTDARSERRQVARASPAQRETAAALSSASGSRRRPSRMTTGATGSPASSRAYSLGWSSFQTPHLRKMRSSEPSRIAAAQDVVARVAQRRPGRREHADVVADGDGVRLNREAGQRTAAGVRRARCRAARHRRGRAPDRCTGARRLRTRPPGCRGRARRAAGCRTRSCRSSVADACVRADRRACGSAARPRSARSGLRGIRSRESSARARRGAPACPRCRSARCRHRRARWTGRSTLNVIMDELRRAPEAAREQVGDLDVEADLRVRVRGVGFDKRRAALGIARPAERRRLRRGRGRQQAAAAGQAGERGSRDDTSARSSVQN